MKRYSCLELMHNMKEAVVLTYIDPRVLANFENAFHSHDKASINTEGQMCLSLILTILTLFYVLCIFNRTCKQRIISKSPAGLSTCTSMSAWACPGQNTRVPAHPCPPGPMLFRSAWSHMGPPGNHRMGMGPCLSQVCMAAHGPCDTRAYH